MSDIQDAYTALLQTDYCTYCEHVNNGWIATRFHEYLCKTVQEFITRPTDRTKAYEILIISTPPQHGKSLTITETLPSWYLGRNPTKKVIEISYSSDFAERFGRNNRRKIKENCGTIFGIELADNPNSVTNFELSNHRGGMISCGVISGVTGNGASLMIIDDPIKTREEADSETMREKLWLEWESSYKSRLAAGAKIIVIMTRWHEDDFAGRLIENETNVEVVNLPLEAEENDPLGRKPGESLCPEIGKDDNWLKDFKRGYMTQSGSRAWNALYQGRPVAMSGNLVKREWWTYYDELPFIQDWLMSVDATFKDKEDNDFVAIQVWGKTGPDMYLVDSVKKHLDFPSTIREIVRLRGMYDRCKVTLIEDKANGSAVIQILRRAMHGIIAIDPIGGKVARVNAISGAIESGNVHVPRNKPFTQDFIDEFSSFPNGKHDDQVDCCSQALNRFIYHRAERPAEKIRNTFYEAFPKAKRASSGSAVGKGEEINVI